MNYIKSTPVDRKEQLLGQLSSLGTPIVQIHELEDLLQQKCGFQCDMNLFSQMIELASTPQGMVSLEAFVDAYMETEQTLEFRIEMLTNRINEKKIERNQLDQRITGERSHTAQNHILVQVQGATNMEPGKLSPEINSYAIVRFGKEAFHTRQSQSSNPVWSESFDFMVPDSGNENLTIEVYDTNRGQQNEFYGSLSWSVQELKKNNVKDVNQNLIRRDIKMKTKLLAKIKYIQSKENTLHQEKQKMSEEILQLEAENRENTQAIMALHRPFGNISYTNYGGYSEGNKLRLNNNSGQFAGHQFLEIHNHERDLVDKMQSIGLINDWTKSYLRVYAVFLAVCLLTSLYRTMYLDLTLTAMIATYVIRRTLTQQVFRAAFLGFLLQFIIDLIWLMIFTKQWTNYPGETPGQNHIKHFTVVMSIILMIIRVPFTVLSWKHSVHFEELTDYLASHQYLN